jgi:small subunit ribosomal protein S4
MAKYVGPKCKRCRKYREKLFLRGEKCLSDKCTLMKRGEMPEVRGRRRVSAYSIQLREKQKLRMMYGILETQFHNYFTKAAKSKNTAAALVILLERRLDNVVFRMGFADSRAQARQFVRHGLITVNGRRINIPSYLTDAGDIIGVKGGESMKVISAILVNKQQPSMAWLTVAADRGVGTVVRQPSPDDVKDIPCNTQLIVELYSK